MENPDGSFTCLHCTKAFARRHATGRKPQYCAATCRQRAYEARHRAGRYPRPRLPPPHPAPQRIAHRYEAGRSRGLYHALRPHGLPNRRQHRQTLCGTWATAIRPPFDGPGGTHPHDNCQTCTTIATTRPATRTIQPAHDLAVLTHLITHLPPQPDNLDLFTYLALNTASPPRVRPAQAA